MTEQWAHWSCKTYPNGRQRWAFSPPKSYQNFTESDWQTEEGKKFLALMSDAFIFNKVLNPNSADKVYRQQRKAALQVNDGIEDSQIFQSAYKAVQYYQSLQADSGYWPGDYGGPLFLTPGIVIASYVTETPLSTPCGELIKRYFLNHQNNDGGWGLHIEGPSTMFGTVLQYVSLRLLGAGADEDALLKAKKWIADNGGATGIPLWGKFYLSVLGVYEWDGINSLCPEMWLLPKWLPMHPSRYWCHARMVYLPMGYCFAKRVTGKITPLIEELRKEIYTENYYSIDWQKARNQCVVADLCYPQSGPLKFANGLMNLYEKVAIKGLRQKACGFILDYINAEDEQTNYIDIGPVNQAINTICVWHAYGEKSVPFKKHVDRWYDYLWLAEDGMKMNGYNGSQLWDTAFALQAMLEGGFEKYFPDTISKAQQYIDSSQIKEEVNEHKKYFRHDSVGGWPFSTGEHGWPITDCTAEGLKTLILIAERGIQHTELNSNSEIPVLNSALSQPVDLILSFQNKDGGWASYELTRAPKWIELLNPSEIFGNIMLDYSYTECTSACVQSLVKFREHYPNYRANEVEQAIKGGIRFILNQQMKDGSWYGSWAVCFTYGTWFAIEALTITLKTGLLMDIEASIYRSLADASGFLLSKQSADGGWGESFESCVSKKYVRNISSQIINSSWALLSLMAIENNDSRAIERGIKFLQSRQFENGDFPQENISGVFNHNCGITYTSYRNVFPIWALGRYLKKYRAA